MASYRSPGLYRERKKASAGSVSGAAIGTYASVGWLRKGPINKAVLITSFDSFQTNFGTYWRNSYLPTILDFYFQNGGAQAYIVRVVPDDAVKAASSALTEVAQKATFYSRVLPATVTFLSDTKYNLKIGATTADVTGDLGDAGTYPLATIATNIAAMADVDCVVENNRLKITSATAGAAAELLFSLASSNDCSLILLGLDADPAVSVKGKAASTWTVEAQWQGSHYNQQRMMIEGNTDNQEKVTRGSDTIFTGGFTKFDIEIQEESAVGGADWSAVELHEAVVFDDAAAEDFAPTLINDDTDNLVIKQGATFTTPSSLKATERAGEIVQFGDGVLVTFSGSLAYTKVKSSSLQITAGLIVAKDNGKGALLGTGVVSGTINYDTGAYSITYTVAPALAIGIVADYWQAPAVTSLATQVTGGTDGTGPLARANVSAPALGVDRKGLYALREIEDLLNLSLPDFAGDVVVANDLFAFANENQLRYVILATAAGLDAQEAAKFVSQEAQYGYRDSAIYYPWVTISDPIANNGRTQNIPPDGFVAGAYSRTALNRGIGKAPAGIVDGALVGSVGLERVLDKGERDLVYGANINPLISSRATGRCIWGCRSLSRDTEWRYVNHALLFQYCEKSVEDASSWVVFENNNPSSRNILKMQGEGFLLNEWRNGNLAGGSPSEAFYVVCDETNNTPSEVDAGLFTCDYFIAPETPGEFVRLRFQKKLKKA